jgi:hypothetical protein
MANPFHVFGTNQPLILPSLDLPQQIPGATGVSPGLFSGGLTLGSIFLAVAIFFLVRVFIRKK